MGGGNSQLARRTPQAIAGAAALIVALAGALLSAGTVRAQDPAPAPDAPAPAPAAAATTVWDLKLGSLAGELPVRAYIDYACGTHGGPPATPLKDWTEFLKCPAEPKTGFHEVYFRTDDEAEYRARALNLDSQIAVYQYTAVYDVPVIAGALFDADGFLVGLRLATDPRVDTSTRENGSSLLGFLKGRFGEENFICADLPRSERESDYQGIYINQECRQENGPGGVDIFMQAHQFRKAGQAAENIDGPTRGQFESTTFFEEVLHDPIPDRAARLATEAKPEPTELDRLAERAQNCPGCDLRGADLKRANLTGANLAGADLTGANLHAAVLAKADLTGAILKDANLDRADLRLARLPGATLDGALLYAARLDGADLGKASLDGIHAQTAAFARANLAGARMRQSDFRRARLNDADFAAADLSASALDDAQMTRSNLAGAKLIRASLWRTNLTGGDLSGADARGADFFGAILRDGNLLGADFSYSRLTSANLRDANFSGAKFTQALLPPGFDPAPAAPAPANPAPRP